MALFTPQPRLLKPLSPLASYRCTHTHTHTHVGRRVPRGLGGTRGGRGEGGHLPKTMSAPSQGKCVTGLAAEWGAQWCQAHPLPVPRSSPPPQGTMPRAPCALPAAVLPLNPGFCCRSGSHSPRCGTADLRCSDGGMWLRRVPRAASDWDGCQPPSPCTVIRCPTPPRSPPAPAAAMLRAAG